MTEEQFGGWVVIPPSVLFSEQLNSTQKLLWGRIFGALNEEGFCDLTNKELGKTIDVSERAVRNSLSQLELSGFIQREVLDDERRLYCYVSGRKYISGGEEENFRPLTEDEKDVIDIESKASENTLVNNVTKVFKYWLEIREKYYPNQRGPKPKLTSRRKKAIQARLREGYSVDDLKLAIEGCFSNEYNRDHGYTDLDLICRENKTRQYINWYYAKVKKREKPVTNGPTPLSSILEDFDDD